jgi:hypothetical protein
MILDYDGFGYKPDYGYKMYEGDKLMGSCSQVRDAYCFREVFNKLQWARGAVHGIYTLRCKKEFVMRSGNYCSLEKAQIRKILRYMRRVFEMKIHFTETNDNYVFVMDIEGKPIKHKFVLTFSRVFFEFPYNEIAKDVLRLREIGVFNNINYSHKSFLELFHTMCVTHDNAHCCGHSLFDYPCDDLSVQKLKKAFERGISRVQDVYEGSWQLDDEIPHLRIHNRTIDWDEGFERRARKYSENFNRLRQKKNAKGIRRRARKAL